MQDSRPQTPDYRPKTEDGRGKMNEMEGMLRESYNVIRIIYSILWIKNIQNGECVGGGRMMGVRVGGWGVGWVPCSWLKRQPSGICAPQTDGGVNYASRCGGCGIRGEG
jgi:hypothetical protein